MKEEAKTIIIGILITILAIFLFLFMYYKIDQKKENPKVKPLSSNQVNTKIDNTQVTTETNEEKEYTAQVSNNTQNEKKEDLDDKEINKVTIYLFHGKTCPHCVRAISTLTEKKNTTYQNVEIKTYEVWNNVDNRTLMTKVAEKLNIEANSVPFFVIGDFSRAGYNEEQILQEITKKAKDKNYKDIVDEVIKENRKLNLEMKEIN